MVLDVEQIIENVVRGDQDAVLLLLNNYNTQVQVIGFKQQTKNRTISIRPILTEQRVVLQVQQVNHSMAGYAECFFFNTEEQDRKKQKQLEEFRKNKVRDYDPGSDSDTDSETDQPDLLLRQHLAAALLCFISNQLQPAVLQVCLHTLRILSRDRRALGPLVTDEALFILAHLGGITLKQEQGGAEGQPARRAASSWDEAEAASCSVRSGSGPGEVSAAATNGSVHHCDKQRGDGDAVVLLRGKKDTWAGKSEEEEEDGEVCRKEAIKVLCNVVYNSPRAQERASALRLLQGLWENLKQEICCSEPPGGQFYRLRLLFLLTALRPELRMQLNQDRGVSVLTRALERILAVSCSDEYEVLTDTSLPPVSKETSQEVIEVLKTLFNIAHTFYRQEPDEEEAALYRHLAAVLRHCLLLSCEGDDVREELQGHTVNLLSALPLTCLDVLLSGRLDQTSHQWGGVNMDCVHTLLLFMDRRLTRGQKLKEKLTPVLNLLTESSRVHRETRHYLRQQILPPLRDVAIRPEQDVSLRGQLVRLMTHVDTDVKHCAAELLFVLCKENVSRFVKYTGYGNAAGLLAARGLLNGRRASGDGHYAAQYSSDSDSDTEEYREAKARINLVTGRVEAEQPDPMEGLTEEEKEQEARYLIGMINRLSREQIIQPMGITAEGRLAPLWAQMRGCTLEEEEDEEEEDWEPEGRKDESIE